MSISSVCKNVKCDPCWQNESECARANFELQAKEVKNVEFEVFTKMSLLKLVHLKMKISPCFTHPNPIGVIFKIILAFPSVRIVFQINKSKSSQIKHALP